MELALRHQIVYQTKGVIPVEVVSKSLLANEALVRKAVFVLGGCVPNAQFSIQSIGVQALENASPLKSVFAVAVFVAFQEDLQREVPKIVEKLTGQQVPDDMHTLITVLVLIVAIYAIDSAVSKVSGARKAERLTRELEAKVQRASELSGLPGSVIRDAVEAHVRPEKEKSIVQKAMELFLPSKVEGNAPILLPDGETIAMEVIADIPLDAGVPSDSGLGAFDLDGVRVEFHRADRDQNKHGWRVVIPTVSDKKVRAELDETIRPDSLYGVTSVIGDVTVIEGPDEAGEIGPRVYRLNAIRARSRKP